MAYPEPVPSQPARSAQAMRLASFLGLLLLGSRGAGVLVRPPQPAERLGQDGATMFAIVLAVAVLELVVVLGPFQGGSHLLVGQRPVAVEVVQVIGAVLQKDTD